MRKQIIVCSAIRQNDLIVCGARHFDKVMNNVAKLLDSSFKANGWEQGFIDQFGVFLDRFEALEVCKMSGQSIDFDRNGKFDRLFSEGLY